jgi:Mg2+ and Co2+ transporter CorA
VDILLIGEQSVASTAQAPASRIANTFLWIDATHDEVSADPEAWRTRIASMTGTQIYDLHLADIRNLQHPSYFDSTSDYGMVVFRKLVLAPAPAANPDEDRSDRKIPPALGKLATVPVSFVLTDNALITVRPAASRTIDAAKAKLLAYQPTGTSYTSRPPASPEELTLRLLNAMVDQYLELRQPLSSQLDRWQRALLNPKRPFNDWMALLDARNELHKLDRLCEEQHDAIQELRDHFIDTYENTANGRAKDLLLVRANDVMEHIGRVLNHARRLESSLESAVQIHFASVSHRTSETMRVLTVITALFMPLTLITGIFGMNFVEMPLLKQHDGFWITITLMMIVLVVGVIASLAWKAQSNKKAP